MDVQPFFYSLSLFIPAGFVCRQVIKENVLEWDGVCASSDGFNTWLAASCNQDASAVYKTNKNKKKQQMEQITRCCEAKCTFDNKVAAVSCASRARLHHLTAITSEQWTARAWLGEKHLGYFLIVWRCSRSCGGSGGFPGRPGPVMKFRIRVFPDVSGFSVCMTDILTLPRCCWMM